MKKYVLFFIIIISLFSCHGQIKKKYNIKTSNKNENTMKSETFDTANFNKNKNKIGEYNFTLEDGTLIHQKMQGNYYEETILKPKPNLYETQKKYSKSGILIKLIKYYPKDFMVLKKEYNDEGKLMNEIDYDQPYKFSFIELIQFLKNNYPTINLNHQATIISRGMDEQKNKFIWEVRWTEKPGRIEKLIIDGVTGKLIDKTFNAYIDN